MAVSLQSMATAVVTIAVIAMIGGAAGLALASFKDDPTINTGSFQCGTNGTDAFNISCNGETGILNTTGQLGTIGTVLGVAVLISIVIMAFSFARQ